MDANAAALAADTARRTPTDLCAIALPLELSARIEVHVASSSWTCSRLFVRLVGLIGVRGWLGRLMNIRSRHGSAVSTAYDGLSGSASWAQARLIPCVQRLWFDIHLSACHAKARG
jgi:hypothetical protein